MFKYIIDKCSSVLIMDGLVPFVNYTPSPPFQVKIRLDIDIRAKTNTNLEKIEYLSHADSGLLLDADETWNQV